MQAACEGGEVFALLEGGCGGAREAAAALSALFGACREPWPARALLAYHARTGSARALELLARAPEPHARHLLDALLEQLRAERPARLHALAALAPLLARRPAWLAAAAAHGVARELVRAARSEREPVPQLHALLALAALAPALGGAHAHELAEAAARAGGAGEAAPAARALFRAVYAAAPVAAVEALRGCGAEAGAAREAWERAVAALAAGVPLHPALVTGSRRERDEPPPPELPPPPEPQHQQRLWRHSPAPPPPPGSTAQAARAAGALRPGGDGWWSLGERSGAESAPHTPLPAEPDAAEPEPAVEATPENTPARPAFRFPGEGGAARALGRPSPAPSDAYAARLQRVAAERRANESPVPIGGAPPPAAPRPEPRAPSAEDREVCALTARAPPPAWPAPEPPVPDPRAAAPAAPARRAPGPPARRAPSAPPAPRARTDRAVQTVDAWPEPYRFLLADFYRTAPDDAADQASETTERLDAYLSELYEGRAGSGPASSELGERLALAHAQLLYERWRREGHAERNRRLLGRCRRLHALELHNAALHERVRELSAELDALRERARRPPPPPPAAHDADAALREALERERAARLRAEAARAEAEAARERDAHELRRTRADGFEAARHVEALARAALSAERRAEHVRRLRRELLLLSEHAAGADRAAAPPDDDGSLDAAAARALRAAAARAEAEAGAATARAEAATARAHELEAAVSARDAAVAELKRATRAAAEEGAARARALQDKYAALQAVLRAAEARRLEELAEAR